MTNSASSFCGSVHSINFMLTLFVHQSDTHTHRQPARRPVCVCQWEERGGRGEHDCPFMWGRGHLFQSRVFCFVLGFFQSFRHLQLYLIQPEGAPPPTHTLLIGYSPEALPQHTTLLDTVLRSLPFRLTTPQWIQSRGPAPS